jgi:hypothetical protein
MTTINNRVLKLEAAKGDTGEALIFSWDEDPGDPANWAAAWLSGQLIQKREDETRETFAARIEAERNTRKAGKE